MAERAEQLQIGRRTLEARCVGPAHQGGPVLVFLHEGLGSAGLWREFPARLCDAAGVPGFVYSRSGYGRSSAEPLPRLTTYMHDEAWLLAQVLSAARIADCLLFGHSDGASIALLFAGALGGAPAPIEPPPPVRLRGLILEAPHLFAEEISLRSIAAMREAWMTTDLQQRLARWHQDPEAAFWGWCGPWLDPAFRRWNIESSLPGITAPVLAIQGEDDEYGTTAQLEALQRGLRGPWERVLLPACGHAPHKDQPEAVLEHARRFLARCLPRPPEAAGRPIPGSG